MLQNLPVAFAPALQLIPAQKAVRIKPDRILQPLRCENRFQYLHGKRQRRLPRRRRRPRSPAGGADQRNFHLIATWNGIRRHRHRHPESIPFAPHHGQSVSGHQRIGKESGFTGQNERVIRHRRQQTRHPSQPPQRQCRPALPHAKRTAHLTPRFTPAGDLKTAALTTQQHQPVDRFRIKPFGTEHLLQRGDNSRLQIHDFLPWFSRLRYMKNMMRNTIFFNGRKDVLLLLLMHETPFFPFTGTAAPGNRW